MILRGLMYHDIWVYSFWTKWWIPKDCAMFAPTNIKFVWCWVKPALVLNDADECLGLIVFIYSYIYIYIYICQDCVHLISWTNCKFDYKANELIERSCQRCLFNVIWLLYNVNSHWSHLFQALDCLDVLWSSTVSCSILKSLFSCYHAM